MGARPIATAFDLCHWLLRCTLHFQRTHLYPRTSENIKNHKLDSVELFSGNLALMAYSYESSSPRIREM